MQPRNCKISRYYLDSNTSIYKPYRKANDETLYIHAKSNLPADILKQLPISVKIRLSNLSSNPKIFDEASKHYQNNLNQSGYDYKLQYKPPNNENENKSKSSKKRKRNIIWFNLPFPKNVSNNISKYFLLLNHFFKSFLLNSFYRIITKNNVKISYSCTTNIKSTINMHIKEVITVKNASSKL